MKDRSETRARLRGLFNITVTPFRRDGAFDFTALEANIERVLALGFDGLLIGGTYGEFAAMTPDERATLFRRTMDIVGDRAPVMLCSAASDVRVARDLTALAGELGGLPMVTPPYVSEITHRQAVAFFREIAPLSRTGVLIYNAPGVGITLPPHIIEELSDVEGVVGVKQGDLTPTIVDQLAGRLLGKLRLFCASDLVFPGPIMAGFDGLSSTNSCALPELLLASYRAFQDSDTKLGCELHRLWYPFRALAREYGQPQTVKAAMHIRGFEGGSVRPPLSDLNEEERSTVGRVIETILST